MGNAYTPGLKVSPSLNYRSRRILPIPGDVLVKVGDHVDCRDIVAQTFMPGEITPVNLSNLLSMPPSDVPECMVKKEGDRVQVGDVLAQTKGIFGFFKNTLKSKWDGTIETISAVTGQMILRGEPVPVQVQAYLTGTVVEVIPSQGVVVENEVSMIQGIFGIGGEAFGPIRMAVGRHDEDLKPDMISADMKGCVVVGGARIWNEAVKKAISVGASAIVGGGIDDQDLKSILGYDLGVAITGGEKIGTTVVITEGFGDIAMAERTFDLLKSREGDFASVNGATQIRAGVMRPEVVVPLTPAARQRLSEFDVQKQESGLLELGRPVRIIRDPYFGLIGEVAGLPPEPRVLGSGSKARVLEVQLGTGERVVIPRANVELIEA